MPFGGILTITGGLLICGLAVLVAAKETSFPRGSLEEVGRLISHRGPDDLGIEELESGNFSLSLIHTRLSIIDLSERGSQPFVSQDGRWRLVFNGEIYNFIELREELSLLGCGFRTSSDTEVLLWAWIRWGELALPKLRGMFSFVVFDLHEQTATAVRDSFGIKPLYFCLTDKAVGFASELSAVRKLLSGHDSMDYKSAYEYLAFGLYDRGERTFFDGILSVRPGELAVVDFSGTSLHLNRRVWRQRPSVVSVNPNWETGKQMVRETLRRSVEIHMRSDVGIGVALSGGLDSSVLTALVRDIEPDAEIETFSFVSPGQASDESFWSDRVAVKLGTKQHIVSPSASQVSRDIDDVVKFQGEPFGSLSIYAQYAVYREARSAGLPVMLDGQGGDEVFAGYSGYVEFVLRSMISDGKLADAFIFLRNWSSYPRHSVSEAFLRLAGTYLPSSLGSIGAKAMGRTPIPPWLKVAVLAESGVYPRPPVLYGYPIQQPAGNRELAKRLSEALFSGEMVNLLRHGDRNSMRWSIESRVPFLSDDVVALAQSLPESFLVSPSGLTKNILRHAMRGLLPDDVLFRRDKVGFEAPDLEWLREMASRPEVLLEGLELIPWIDPDQARKYLLRVWEGKQHYSHSVWRLINLAKWRKTYT